MWMFTPRVRGYFFFFFPFFYFRKVTLAKSHIASEREWDSITSHARQSTWTLCMNGKWTNALYYFTKSIHSSSRNTQSLRYKVYFFPSSFFPILFLFHLLVHFNGQRYLYHQKFFINTSIKWLFHLDHIHFIIRFLLNWWLIFSVTGKRRRFTASTKWYERTQVTLRKKRMNFCTFVHLKKNAFSFESRVKDEEEKLLPKELFITNVTIKTSWVKCNFVLLFFTWKKN